MRDHYFIHFSAVHPGLEPMIYSSIRRMLTAGLVSLSIVSIELVWLRILSAELFYTFAFLVLSTAVLGLGLGSLSLKLCPGISGRSRIDDLLILAALVNLAAVSLTLRLGLDMTRLFSSSVMVSRFLLAAIMLGLPFLIAGMVLGMLFKYYVHEMPRLYMADLVGAGTGVVLSVFLMNTVGVPATALLNSLFILLAALASLRGKRVILPAMTILLTLSLLPFAWNMASSHKPDRAPVIYRHWDSMASLKIYEFSPEYQGINLDNAANSPVYGFDGNWEARRSDPFEFGISVKYLIEITRPCRFLSLGSGGGVDVLQALQEGAEEIHAVEVNSHINDLMTRGNLASFSGRIYDDPRVRVVTEDARAYVRTFEDHFDLIYSLSSNTFAAMASGSFSLAENYLFTTEAFEDYYTALTKKGFLMMEHQFYMPRLVTQALHALSRLGIERPETHIAVYDLPNMKRMVLLMGKQPLTPAIIEKAFGNRPEGSRETIYPLYPVGECDQDHLIRRIVTGGWESAAAATPIDISPCTDDRPFAAQLGMWKNFSLDSLDRVSPYEFRGYPLSRLIIVLILGFGCLVVVPLTLLPFLTGGRRLGAAGWLYFFLIGAGYLIAEIVLIQRYTLFIGSSSHTVAVILFVLLTASGLGSLSAPRFKDGIPFMLILLYLALELHLFPQLRNHLVHLSLLPRMATTILLLFPLGYFMGMPFPKGAWRVKEQVDWGFAVNGVASVIGSTAILLLSFSQGLTASLAVGGGLYLLAGLLMTCKRGWLTET